MSVIAAAGPAIIAVVGGLIAVLAAAFAAGSARRALMRARGEDGSFVGAIQLDSTARGLRSARRVVTTPYVFARFHDDVLIFEITGFGKVAARAISPPIPTRIALRRDEVTRVEVGARRLIFYTVDSSDERNGLAFWPRRRDRAPIADALKSGSFPIALGD